MHATNSAMEAWKPVLGYLGLYEVSDQGRVRSVTRVIGNRTWPGKIRITGAHPRGYRSVVLSVAGSRRSVLVHRLVLEAFVGPCPPGMEACHQDGDRTNNVLVNLRWDDHRSNMADRIRHGTMSQGEQHGCAVLDEASVNGIIRGIRDGETQRAIATDLGVSPSSICRIKKGLRWKHVSRGAP